MACTVCGGNCACVCYILVAGQSAIKKNATTDYVTVCSKPHRRKIRVCIMLFVCGVYVYVSAHAARDISVGGSMKFIVSQQPTGDDNTTINRTI